MSRVIETPRLELRPWLPADADAASAIYTPQTVSRWLGPDDRLLRTPAVVRRQVAEWSAEDVSSDCVGHWAVGLRFTSAVVGALTLEHAPPGGESLTIGWALAPDAWGHGYATEAGDALVRWAIHEGGVDEVFAIIEPDNTRAKATAERIGMEWVTELGHLADDGRSQVYRIRHEDLDYED
ncbi:GNAT family N-acetyltransferase [Nocardioides conyzicola]|uniref:GNAT family N-acetyltransferase n=1 Tax=Nocardioides conyzicola TaxID=1651781 RepID=A0ABP8Y1N7_9ACTN